MSKLYIIRNEEGPLDDMSYIKGEIASLSYSSTPERYPPKKAFKTWCFLRDNLPPRRRWSLETADE